jgi:ABC-type bacteriocin/lantibiotic exporter with double-glycine peptidase domain
VLLSNIRNWRQQHEDDCLVASCKTVLDYLGIEKDKEWLWHRLLAGEVTPFPNIKNLAATLGVVVEVQTDGTLEMFESLIESGLPVIVAVDADSPRYWPYVRHHAVVVIGFDEQRVFVNDPAQPEEPLEVDVDTFLLAWLRRNYQYAVLRLQQAP